MAANLIGPERGRGPDGDPSGSKVVALPIRRAAAGAGETVALPGATAAVHWFGSQFTPADHTMLAAWIDEAGHGYDRLRVERGVLEDGTWATYALIYVPGQAWSSWGVMRRNDHVEVWRCGNGRTVGRHQLLVDALASLPHATDQRRALPRRQGAR